MARASKPTRRVVEPPRPLGVVGRKLWDEIHEHGEVRGSIEPLLMLCERLDERTSLRVRVFSTNDPADRAGLRALDALIDESLERLGIRSILPMPATAVKADSWVVNLASVRG